MPKLISIILLLLLTAPIRTDTPENILIRANWNSGEMVRYEFIETIMTYDEGVLVDEKNYRSIFHIDVAGVQGNQGYLLLWQLVSTNAPLFDDEVLDDYMYGLLGNGIVIHTDRLGTFTHSSNLRDIHKMFREAVATLDRQAHWYGKGQHRQQLNYYLNDYNLFQDVMLRDFRFMHGMHGVQLVLDDEYEYDTWQQNPWGENIESTGTLYVTNYDPETGMLEVTNRVELQEEVENLFLSEIQHYKISTGSGWVQQVELIDNILYNEYSRERTLLIRRIQL